MNALVTHAPFSLRQDEPVRHVLEALESCRCAIQAEALAIAYTEGQDQWRIACAGPSADALAQAFHDAMSGPLQQHPKLRLHPLGGLERSFLIVWSTRVSSAALDALAPFAALALQQERDRIAALTYPFMMLDALPFAALLVGRNLEIKSANARARTLLDRRLSLWSDRERLTFAEARDAQCIADCMDRAFNSGDGARPALTRLRDGAQPYPVAVLAAGTHGLIIIVDREDDMRALWRGMMELDAAELHLASAILAARELGAVFGS